MTGFLIDTNVIIDVLRNDPAWRPWFASTLERCADSGMLIINPIIYSELAVGQYGHAGSSGNGFNRTQ